MNARRSETEQAVLDATVGVLGRVDDLALLAEPRARWLDLAEAGLLALPVPEEYGGDGLGLAETGVLLQELGRRALDLPVWETLVCGALPVVRVGTVEQQARLLPRVADGRSRFAVALSEPGRIMPSQPSTSLCRRDGGWVLRGRKVHVTGLAGPSDEGPATVVLVSATVEGSDRRAVVLLEPDAARVQGTSSWTSASSSRHGPEHSWVLDEVPVTEEEVLGGPPGSDEADRAARMVREHAVAGLCLLGDGLVRGGRDLTASYVRTRHQFGRALAEFQAVAMQMADVYVAARTIGLTAASAAWRVDQQLPAADDLAVAASWFSQHGPESVHTCHHVHGGTGVDLTYPLHRYYAGVKDVARLLGGPGAWRTQVPVQESQGKNLELTAQQRAFKDEARTYFAGLMTPEDRRTLLTERHGETYHRIIKQLGADGWLGVGWPREYGGRGLGELEQQIFVNEAARSDVHLPAVTLQTVGPTLMAHGSEEQKQTFLADILTGDVHFAIGYSEPEAGTDLASLRTSARREGDEYVVNGQKMWTTGGHDADYVWLAVRTDPDAPKHRGISVLIVDTRDPGYSWTPVITADRSHHVNATSYDDVRVPVSMRVGEENDGWRLITSQLNHERVMLAPAGRIEGIRDLLLDWAARHTAPDGRPVLDQRDVREALAEMTAVFRVNELLNWEVSTATEAGEPAVADASASKVFASEQLQQVGRLAEEILGRYGDPADPDTAELAHYLDSQAKRYLVLTFGGGVNEVQRELICMFGLNLPKVPR